MCFPSSFKRWKKKHNIPEEKEIQYSSDKGNKTCHITVWEHSEKDWESLHTVIKEDRKLFSKYPKVCNSSWVFGLHDHLTRVPGHQLRVRGFVELLLLWQKDI